MGMPGETSIAAGSGTIEIRVLGPVDVRRDGADVDVGHTRQRLVLALLVARMGVVTSTNWLIEQLWQDRPPQRARETMWSYLSRLRKLFAGTDVTIERRPGGFMLNAGAAVVDMHRFRELVALARRSGAAADWDAALALWRGEPFADCDVPLLDRLRTTLEPERFAAVLDRNDALLADGGHSRVLPQLRELVEHHPWDERLAGQFMRALDRCGRATEALDHYRALSTRFVTERGTEPGAELAGLHRAILTRGEPRPEPARRPRAVPRQLPGDIHGFAGRAEQLRRLDRLPAARGRAVAVCAITGTAGIGKTALAVHWAHRAAAKFPDGQLYANLRGFDLSGRVVTPAEAVRGFLDGLDVPASRIPSGFDAQTALFRSLVADRRILIVLDNARDAEQVRPLLPGGKDCLVLVTSRDALAGLVVSDAATPLPVTEPPVSDCRRLLANRLGPDRVADTEAADGLIEACVRLPLALSIMAARAATDPELGLAELTERLRDERSALDALDAGDAAADLRAVLSWSYRTLSAAAAGAFRLLGLYPGVNFPATAVAGLLGVPVADARVRIEELEAAHLVERRGTDRYTFHDLLRAYARERVEQETDRAEREAALRRLLDHQLHTALAATHRLNPGRPLIDVAEPTPGAAPVDPADYTEAVAWFLAETGTLIAAVELAADQGFDSRAHQLAWALGDFLCRQGQWNDWVRVQRIGVEAADRDGDLLQQARGHRDLGRAFNSLDRVADAEFHLGEALRLCEEYDGAGPQGSVHSTLARMYNQNGRHELALEHNLKALGYYRRDGQDQGVAVGLNNLGWTYALLGDHAEAIAHCERALDMQTAVGFTVGQSSCLDSLGYVHQRLGKYERAIEYYTRSLELAERGGSERFHRARGLARLGDVNRALGHDESAVGHYREAQAIFVELDHPDADDVAAKLREIGA